MLPENSIPEEVPNVYDPTLVRFTLLLVTEAKLLARYIPELSVPEAFTFISFPDTIPVVFWNVIRSVGVLNTTLAPITGIAVNGFNNSVDGNTVALKFYKVNPGLATGIGNIMGLPGNFGNLSISGNAVTFEFPHVSLFNSSYFVGINYRGNSASGLSIIGNTVTGPVLSGLAGTPSVIGSVKTGPQVSHNIIYGTGGILATGNNTTISFNNISYINPDTVINFYGYGRGIE